jgi:cytochrome c553
LKLVEAHAEIARRFGNVDIIALFEHPNIRDLAAHLAAKPSARGERQAPPNRQGNRQAEALKRLRAAKSR